MIKKFFEVFFAKKVSSFFSLTCLSLCFASETYAEKAQIYPDESPGYQHGISLIEEGRYLEAAVYLFDYPNIFMEHAEESDDALFVLGIINEKNGYLDKALLIYQHLAEQGYPAAEEAIASMLDDNQEFILEELKN
jgi:predicted S18 family serine protease